MKAATKNPTSIIGQDRNLNFLKHAIEHNVNTLLVGETGTGKTSMIRELAAHHKRQVVRFTLTGETTVDDFVGKYELEEQKTIWKDGVLLTALKKGHWLVVDEINAALPEILFVLHSLLDDDRYVMVASHEGEIVKPHKNFRFFATMNPMDEYAGTKDMNKAFMSRFDMILEVGYPENAQEVDILTNKTGVDRNKAFAMVSVAQKLRDLKKDHKIFYTCSTRDLIQWGKLVHSGLSMAEGLLCAVVNKAASKREREEIIRIADKEFAELAELVKKHGRKITPERLYEAFQTQVKREQEFEKRKADFTQEIIEKITADLTEKLDPKAT